MTHCRLTRRTDALSKVTVYPPQTRAALHLDEGQGQREIGGVTGPQSVSLVFTLKEETEVRSWTHESLQRDPSLFPTLLSHVELFTPNRFQMIPPHLLTTAQVCSALLH